MNAPRSPKRSRSCYAWRWSAIITLWAATTNAFGGDYIEISSGDLSGDRLTPTSWNVTAGSNRLIAATSPGDQEYLRVNVPAGHFLKSIELQLYTTSDAMFIGVQQGTIFTVTPGAATAADMYGYAHFGNSENNVGTDILDDMGAAPGAIGFTPPLPSGSYTFWLQQGTPGSTLYQFDFEVFLPGDYNGNGIVDAADYTVWRNTVGSASDFRADGTGPSGTPDQVVDRLDYNFWKLKYADGAGSAAAAEFAMAPEPVSVTFASIALICLGNLQARNKRRSRGPPQPRRSIKS